MAEEKTNKQDTEDRPETNPAGEEAVEDQKDQAAEEEKQAAPSQEAPSDKEDKKAEDTQEQKSEETKEGSPETPEEPAPESPEAGPVEEAVEPAPAKKKKINKMTLVEIEARLKATQEAQGGLDSKYARQLLERKKTLSSQS